MRSLSFLPSNRKEIPLCNLEMIPYNTHINILPYSTKVVSRRCAMKEVLADDIRSIKIFTSIDNYHFKLGLNVIMMYRCYTYASYQLSLRFHCIPFLIDIIVMFLFILSFTHFILINLFLN
uniref:Uncharacterized protein n=1 Tax=Parascaris univalens TaxID=6257 RepID=A0A915AFB7_PARUN